MDRLAQVDKDAYIRQMRVRFEAAMGAVGGPMQTCRLTNWQTPRDSTSTTPSKPPAPTSSPPT